MCRWLAYSGSPILLTEALYTPRHSLIEQSLHSRLGTEATNGDGFGVGWYDDTPAPGVFYSTEPAWNDFNLHELAAHLRSGRFFAHIRAAIGSAVQDVNEFAKLKRDLAFAVDPSLLPEIRGTTDTEMLFHLALTFGLQDDPQGGDRAGDRARRSDRARLGVPNPFQGTIATTDGSGPGPSGTPARASRARCTTRHPCRIFRELLPDDPRAHELSDDMRIIVSEPLGDIAGVWNEVPEATCGIVQGGDDELRPFEPKAPALAVALG